MEYRKIVNVVLNTWETDRCGKTQTSLLLRCGKRKPEMFDRIQENPSGQIHSGTPWGKNRCVEKTQLSKIARCLEQQATQNTVPQISMQILCTVINRFVSISEKKTVYCAVRTESVNIIYRIILTMLNTHLHLQVALTRRTNGNPPKSTAISEIEEH
jgi:hypothetical protein